MTPFLSDNTLTLPVELFGFLVRGVFLAERAVLVDCDAIGRILLVLVRPVVAVLAFAAGQGDIRPHGVTS